LPILIGNIGHAGPSKNAAGNPVRLPNTVKNYTSFKVDWEVNDGTRWLYAGQTENHVYVTLGQPTTTAFETVLDIAVRNADGKNTAADSVAAIWNDYKDPIPGVKRKQIDGYNNPDGKEMKYWVNLGTVPAGESEDDLLAKITGRSTIGHLISPEGGNTPIIGVAGGVNLDGVGSCESWSAIFKASLNVMGIGSASVYRVEPDQVITGANPPVGVYWMLVKNWRFGAADAVPDGIFTHTRGTSATDQVGVAGQGTTNPTSVFSPHFLVIYNPAGGNKRIYDPSYGTDFASEAAWEDGSLDGFLKVTANGQRIARNTLNVNEVKFSVVAGG
jgi:hypothetical protein